ncbi:MAG: hypothetical protein GDA48_10625 [Hormoscilla sp. GM102CHS1]|nr:hypothetical protein [Hormoscilla sp. GM102CHS1]
MKTRSQLDAPIVPDRRLGGFDLRTPIRDLSDFLCGLGSWREGFCELVSPFEARYRLGKGEIELAVDVRNSKVFKIAAYPGYKGKLFDKIVVGMKVKTAMEYEPRLFYSEVEAAILCQDFTGLTLDVSEIDPPPELIPDMTISAISVHCRTLHSARNVWRVVTIVCHHLDPQKGVWS